MENKLDMVIAMNNMEATARDKAATLEQICGTCADWHFCPHTEGWRVRQVCSRQGGCSWKPA